MAPMSTETILSATPNLEADALAHAIRELNGGRVLVVPTDTVYGIGCDASNPDAVNAVLAAKGRGRQMPPPVLVASVDAIDSLCVDVPDYARTLARAFWPGGLTLILRARPDGDLLALLAKSQSNNAQLKRIAAHLRPVFATAEGAKLPRLAERTLSGETFTNEKLKGRCALVIFSASWDSSNYRLVSKLRMLRRRFGRRGGRRRAGAIRRFASSRH